MIDKKAEIYRCGKELFEEKGFKDTNVAEIMRKAGFATGSFYRYYPSKDHLFMAIYNEENVRLKKHIIAALNLNGDPMTVMQEMMLANYRGMQENPILREWYNQDVFHKIEQNFRESNAMENVDFLYDDFIEIIRQWQLEGRMRADMDAEMIMAIIGAMINVDLHKDEVGLQYFPKLMDYLGEFIMRGLTDSGGDRENDE